MSEREFVMGSAPAPDRSIARERHNSNYNERVYEIVEAVILEKGVRVLAQKDAFMRATRKELIMDKKMRLYIQLAFDEDVMDELIDVAKESEEKQRSLVFAQSMRVAEEYEIDRHYMNSVLMAFVKALSRANISQRGKNTCAQLKELRRLFAETNGIDYEEEDCTYDGPCEGTCPYCDAKTKELLEKAEQLKEVEYPASDIEIEERYPSNFGADEGYVAKGMI